MYTFQRSYIFCTILFINLDRNLSIKYDVYNMTFEYTNLSSVTYFPAKLNIVIDINKSFQHFNTKSRIPIRFNESRSKSDCVFY